MYMTVYVTIKMGQISLNKVAGVKLQVRFLL